MLASVSGLVVALLVALTAAAHTDVDFTLPADGAVVDEPLAEITVAFGDPVTVIGPGFEVLDPGGNLLTPAVVTDDETVFRLQLDPPLAGGEAAVRYQVRAEDGHTIAGGFSFVITAGAPTTLAPTTSGVPAATPRPTEPVLDPVTTPVPSTIATTDPPDGPATTTAVTAAARPLDVDDDDGSSTGGVVVVVVAVAAAVAVGGAFLLRRSRAPG